MTATPRASVARGPGSVALVAGVAGLSFCFWEPVAGYVADQHYQSHFLFLWVFFFAALWRGTRDGLAGRVAPSWRGRCGIGLVALGALLLHAGLETGSSTAQRLALVCCFSGGLLALAVGWSAWRCLWFGAFALLCFGMPYSAYFQLTKVFRNSFVGMLELLPAVTPLDYRVDGLTLEFADYSLAITPDCSGFHQLLTFLGLAFLGSLTGAPRRGRIALLFGSAVVLAYAANLLRIVVFAVLVALRWYRAIDDEDLHAGIGFATYAPFLLLYVALILRTHTPRPPRPVARPAGGLSWALLVVPLVAVRALHLGGAPPSEVEPAYLAGIATPPGAELVERAPTEARERETYDTPWLINARFATTDGDWFELFSYLTRSRRHLAVHQVSNCLDVPGTDVVYGPPVDVDGRRFWTLELRAGDDTLHGYFAFWVDGQDRDDKLSTQLEVFWQRLWHGVEEVGLFRLLLPGPLAAVPPARDLALLRWQAGRLGAVQPAPR